MMVVYTIENEVLCLTTHTRIIECTLSCTPRAERIGEASWTDILYAQASFEVGDYATATEKATSAFNNCHEVQALAHLARVKELYTKLLASDYRGHTEVKHLGKLLSTVFPRNSP